MRLESNSRLTAAAVPEGTGLGVGPTVEHLAGEGSTVLGEDIARGEDTGQEGIGRQGTGWEGTGWEGTGREGTGWEGTGEVGQQVAGTGEAAHLDLSKIRMM